MHNEIDVAETVGSHLCVASEDGHKVHDRLAGFLQKPETVTVSFRGVRRLTTAFLNAAIGQLYNEFTEEHVRRHVQIAHIDDQSLRLLKKVVDRAKVFYKSQSRGPTETL